MANWMGDGGFYGISGFMVGYTMVMTVTLCDVEHGPVEIVDLHI